MHSIVFIVKSSNDNKEQARTNYMPPLGVLSIANTLRLHGYNVEVLDFSARNYDTSEIDGLIERVKPLYIGFSVYTENIDNVFIICKYLKKRFRNIPLVLGGPHPTLDTEYCKRKRFVDYILVGDGEHNALELAEALRTNGKLIPFEDIQGIVYIGEDGEYKNGQPRRFVTNIDLLPIINRDYVEKSFSAGLPTVYSSRGCPGKCIYCAAPSMSGGKYRMREITNVFLESLYINEVCANLHQIFYCDDTFTVFRKRLETFIQLYSQCKVKFHWRCESRVDSLYRNSSILEGLKAAGCERIQFGIESGNQEVLNNIRKEIELSQAYEIIDKTIKTGIPVVTSFIFGHYCDTLQTMEDTVNMMEKLKEMYGDMIEIAYALNTPFPGTYQYENMDELGMELTAKTFAELDMYGPVVRTKNFDRDDLNRFNSRAVKIYNIGG
ncbi:MAG: B12-binding domain-containing radical SAM protein [Clostridia bacterium]|nr:B12-binding domain-containing radical SAM protein [Clostridia bacterium]